MEVAIKILNFMGIHPETTTAKLLIFLFLAVYFAYIWLWLGAIIRIFRGPDSLYPKFYDFVKTEFLPLVLLVFGAGLHIEAFDNAIYMLLAIIYTTFLFTLFVRYNINDFKKIDPQERKKNDALLQIDGKEVFEEKIKAYLMPEPELYKK